MITSISEHFTDNAGGFTDVLINDGGGNYFEEVGVEGGGYCAGEEGFACSWRAIEEDTFWWFDAYSLEEFRVEEGKFNDLFLRKKRELVVYKHVGREREGAYFS